MRGGLASGMSEYNTASKNLATTRSRIASNSKRLKQLDSSIRVNQERLRGRAAFLYKTGAPGMLDVLLGSASFEEFASRLYVFTQIASQDAALIGGLKSERAESERLRADLLEREAQQKSQRDKVASRKSVVQNQLDQQQAYLASLSAEVAALVDQQEKARDAAAAARQAALLAAKPAAKPKTISAPKPSKLPASKAGPMVMASVEGRSGQYAVLQGQPLSYRPTGISLDGVTTMYGNNDTGGNRTASGRPFDENEFTCAHRSLPFGTRLAVSKGNKKVIVVVTDRGPYTPGRVLDLTRRSARYLGIDGVGRVKIEIVTPAK
jgi:rare lipoprotein A (peptidoglycan hydrolase)